MARRKMSIKDIQQWTPFFAVLIFLTLYFLPLWVLWYAILVSGFFSKRTELIAPLGVYFSNEGIITENILSLVTAVLVGGGIGYLLRKGARRPEMVVYLTLVGYIGLAVVLLWLGNFTIHLKFDFVKEGYTESVANSILKWTSGQVQETLTLFALLLGLKGSEFVAPRGGGSTK